MLQLLGAGGFVLHFIPYNQGPSTSNTYSLRKDNFHRQVHKIELPSRMSFILPVKPTENSAEAAYNGAEKPFQTAVIYTHEETAVPWFS